MFLSNIYAIHKPNWQKLISGFLLYGILVSGSTAFATGTDPKEKSGEVQQVEKTPTLISLKKNPASYAQKRVINSPDPVNSPRLFNQYLSGLAVGGYYRNLVIGRKLTTPYGTVGRDKVMQVGEGYYDPMVMLYVGANPTPTTSFGSELILASPFDVYLGPGANVREVKPYYNMILRGSTNTKYGNFFLQYGGIEWKNLTMFTFGSNVGYNRYTVFERSPWDPVGNIKNRYASYYYTGNINQDMRWGTQGFKGIMLNGWDLPYKTSIDLYYGKTQYLGGAMRMDTVMPSMNFGFKLSKALKDGNRISLNTFSSRSTADSVNSELSDVNWHIYTTEFSFKLIDGIKLTAEVGAGSYESPNFKEIWDEGIIADLDISKKYTLIPLSLRYFQIGQYFTNNSASFSTNSIREVYDGYVKNPNTVVLVPNAAGMMGPGGLANNQRGFAINSSFDIKRFKVSLGNQFSSEMDTLENGTRLSYGHRINGMQWARLPLFFPLAGQIGPNQRVGTFYRGAYEVVGITDPTYLKADSSANFKRHFAGMDIQVKYKTKLFNKDLYLNYLGAFQSAQPEFSPVTVFTPKAFLRAYYNEFEAYYQLSRSLIVSTYLGHERVIGNNATDVDPVTMRPRNQTGKALGFGIDFALSSSTTIFFRHRYFSFEDESFDAYTGLNPNDPGQTIDRAAEAFKGHESTIELKIFF